MMGRSMLAYIPVNLANLVVSFGTIVVLTRLLGSEEFGRYALAVITMHLVHMMLFTWLEAAMARFQARAERNDDVSTHLKTIYTYALGTAIIGFSLIVAILFIAPLSLHMRNLLLFVMTTTTVQIFFNLGMEAHKAAHRIKRYSATYSAHTLISFSIGIILILTTPLREVAPFVGIMIALLLTFCFDLPFMFKRMKGGKIEPEKAKTYFAYGMPICISLSLAYLLNSADVYLIAYFLGESAAGQYNAGYNLSNRSLDIIFVWVAMAATPIAVTLMEKEGVAQSAKIMRDYGAILLWITLPAATGIALVANEFGYLLGESVRAEAVTVMPLIAFAGVLNGLINFYAQRAFMLSGRTGMFVWTMVPPVIINIALNLLWIPKYQLLGAVYATLVSYGVGFVLAIIVARRYYPLPIPVRATIEISVACLLMAGAVMALPDLSGLNPFIALFIKAGLGAVVYGLVSFATNAANSRDLLIGQLKERGILKATTS